MAGVFWPHTWGLQSSVFKNLYGNIKITLSFPDVYEHLTESAVYILWCKKITAVDFSETLVITRNYLEQYCKGHNLNFSDCEMLKSHLVCLCLQLLQYRATRWTSHASVVVTWGYTTVLLTMVCLLLQIRPSTLKFTVSTGLLKILSPSPSSLLHRPLR